MRGKDGTDMGDGGVDMSSMSIKQVVVRVEDIIEQLGLDEEAVLEELREEVKIHKEGLKAEMY
ncbi:hypothetical protein [Paenibacillus sp. NAIST15-1]|uniref:hypothetical protein n=1 Tax=Paenibacillus sp. NAIST15-1 TaxID=1605994 RepID=UPI00086EA131|nr:hypothetical protein [Paenibacillus sp. NAIST15-1]GAV10678.1 hypothetical protein PBN151_0588 [Paenibacillus sp. NAIST15-1]